MLQVWTHLSRQAQSSLTWKLQVGTQESVPLGLSQVPADRNDRGPPHHLRPPVRLPGAEGQPGRARRVCVGAGSRAALPGRAADGGATWRAPSLACGPPPPFALRPPQTPLHRIQACLRRPTAKCKSLPGLTTQETLSNDANILLHSSSLIRVRGNEEAGLAPSRGGSPGLRGDTERLSALLGRGESG